MQLSGEGPEINVTQSSQPSGLVHDRVHRLLLSMRGWTPQTALFWFAIGLQRLKEEVILKKGKK